MTLDQVIELSKPTTGSEFNILFTISTTIIIFALLLTIKADLNNLRTVSWIGAVLALGIILFLYNVDMNGDPPEREQLATWEKDVLIPYLHEQPQEKQTIKVITLSPTRDNANASEEDDHKITFTILYNKAGKFVTHTGSYTVFEAEEGVTEPYFTYVYIPKDLTKTHKKGDYITAIYLPKDHNNITINKP